MKKSIKYKLLKNMILAKKNSPPLKVGMGEIIFISAINEIAKKFRLDSKRDLKITSKHKSYISNSCRNKFATCFFQTTAGCMSKTTAHTDYM